MEAEQSGCDLIVMDVTRRSGEPLFFGETAAAVFEKAPTSAVLLATRSRRPLFRSLGPPEVPTNRGTNMSGRVL
jgi:hypothetical protein